MQAERFKNILRADNSAQVFIFSLLLLFHELYNYLSFKNFFISWLIFHKSACLFNNYLLHLLIISNLKCLCMNFHYRSSCNQQYTFHLLVEIIKISIYKFLQDESNPGSYDPPEQTVSAPVKQFNTQVNFSWPSILLPNMSFTIFLIFHPMKTYYCQCFAITLILRWI